MASLNERMDTLQACLCSALEDAGRPVCECYPAIGQPIWRPCCECGALGTSGELTISLDNMYPSDGDMNLVNRVEQCRRGPWAVDVLVVLTRCYPTVTDDLPDQADIEEAARNLHDDAETLRRAVACCSDIRVAWRAMGVEADPSGGCSRLTARLTLAL